MSFAFSFAILQKVHVGIFFRANIFSRFHNTAESIYLLTSLRLPLSGRPFRIQSGCTHAVDTEPFPASILPCRYSPPTQSLSSLSLLGDDVEEEEIVGPIRHVEQEEEHGEKPHGDVVDPLVLGPLLAHELAGGHAVVVLH